MELEMVRGGKVSGKRSSRKRARSKEGVSDESDEDYVVSDEDRNVSDSPGDYSSLDGCASEDSVGGFMEEEEEEEEEDNFIEEEDKFIEEEDNFIEEEDNFIEEEEEEEEDDDDCFIEEEDEEEEEEIQPARKLYRSRAKNGVCGRKKDASKTTRKRRRVTYVKQEEQEGDADGEEDEDFDYNDDGDADDDDDEEFTPAVEDCSDEDVETGVKKKKNNGVKMRKKVSKRRVSVTSTRRRKRRSSRASKKPLRKKRRKNGGLKRKEKCDDADDFIDNAPAIMTKRRRKLGQEKSRPLLEDSNSDRVSSDYEYTISEEEREQVREAKKLCQSLKRNLRSSSILIHEESAVHEDLHQQQKPPGQKAKEKIKEPQGRKGKEKVEDLKSEVVKQVCGICLSEENKRRIRGVLNCCTHYFCFSCIMEWAKVESRCPLCKQRFKTISKPARASTGVDLREMVVEVPERDQVYQPSEEELRSYIDPYENVFCSECHQGGDDALMLLCDICDSPAHTYCVGLGREVPEGNWYCEGCRPVALGSSSTQVQDRVDDPRVISQNVPVRSLPVLNIPETIDLNLMFSPLRYQNQGFGHISFSRFSGRSVEAASPVSGGGGTLSERRWIHRHIQQLRSTDRMTSIPARTNGISATSSASNLSSPQITHRVTNATPQTRTHEVGSSYHPFLDERLCNNNSPSVQTGDPSSMSISNARRPVVQGSITVSNSPMNGVLWPGLVGTPSISDNGPAHQLGSRTNIVTDVNLPPDVGELQQSNFESVKEQVHSMVKSHLKSLSRGIEIEHNTYKEIARSSINSILAACGLEHKMSEGCAVLPPLPVCSHIELLVAGHMSLITGCCSHCFDSFVRDVVKGDLDTKMSSQPQPWLRLGI